MAGCNATVYIEAPDYCSGCEEFHDAEIGNVSCDNNGTPIPNDDTWSFTLNVPNDNSPLPHGIPLMFDLSSTIGGGTGHKAYNQSLTIPVGNISIGCVEYEMMDLKNPNCKSAFKICPPKPCSDDCRDFNIYVEKVECIIDPRTQQYTGYEVLLDISGIHDTEQKACVSYSLPGSISTIQWGSLTNGLWSIGPFSSDIFLKISVCPKNADCSTCDPDCYKIIYLALPDCVAREDIEKRESLPGSGMKIKPNENTELGELLVIPNPFKSDEVILRSTLKHSVYEIFDSSGKKIQEGDFEGTESRIKLDVPPGIYFVRYKNNLGETSFVKMIKM